MEAGKINYIFNRAWSWMSKLITIFNFLMLIYLTVLQNTLVLIGIPIILILWGILTIIDLKYILPEELRYGRIKDPEWIRFSIKVEKELKEIKETIK